MKFSALATCATAAALLSLSAAQAASFEATLVANLTEDGQDLFFAFDELPAHGGAATVTIASGGSLFLPGLDLTGTFPQDDEYFEATLDGVSLGFYSCGGPSSVGATVIPGTEGSETVFDCEFSLPIALSPTVTADALGDGEAIVGVLFGPGVETFFEQDEVVVSLAYDTIAPVPLPASLPLFAAGLGALGLTRRRRG